MFYIYKLTILDTDYFYYGKSKNETRLIGHKCRCFNEKDNFKLYNKIKELNIIKDNFYEKVKMIKLIENLTIEEAIIEEAKLINENITNEYCLNSRKENMKRRKKSEKYMKTYYKENKEEINQRAKEYYQKNKEKIKEKTICEWCEKEYMKRHCKRHENTNLCKRYQYYLDVD